MFLKLCTYQLKSQAPVFLVVTDNPVVYNSTT